MKGIGLSPSSKPDQRFRDIIDDIVLIDTELAEMSRSDFLVNRLVQDATLFRLLRISEAAAKLGIIAEFRAPEENWARIRTLGNVLRHQYDGIDLEQIWAVVKLNLPTLRQACERALDVTDAD